MYNSRKDGLQIFNVNIKANKLKQRKDFIEIYYDNLIAILKQIDLRQWTSKKDLEDTINHSLIHKISCPWTPSKYGIAKGKIVSL